MGYRLSKTNSFDDRETLVGRCHVLLLPIERVYGSAGELDCNVVRRKKRLHFREKKKKKKKEEKREEFPKFVQDPTVELYYQYLARLSHVLSIYSSESS